MNSLIKSTAAIAALTTISTISFAQKKDLPPIEIGLGLGTLVYQGDLTRSFAGSFKQATPALQLYARKPLDAYFSVQLGVTTGKISEDEARYTNIAWKQVRSFSFTNSVTEVAALIHWNIYGENSYENYRRLNPYVFTGVGATFLNIQRNYSRTNLAAIDTKGLNGLRIDSAKKLPSILPVIPIGFGAKYHVSETLSLFGELSYRFGFSDYLDGFSYAADPSANDSFYGISFGINYRLQKKGRNSCPPIRR
ncbi:MAG: DUF6089 family protein [Chitinophagaceae bacterium]